MAYLLHICHSFILEKIEEYVERCRGHIDLWSVLFLNQGDSITPPTRIRGLWERLSVVHVSIILLEEALWSELGEKSFQEVNRNGAVDCAHQETDLDDVKGVLDSGGIRLRLWRHRERGRPPSPVPY